MEETKQNALTNALLINLVLAMLTRFLVLLYPNLHMLQSQLFGLLPITLAIPMLRISAVRRERGLLFCAALAAWTAITCLIPDYVTSDLYTVLTPFFLTMAFLFIVCYPSAFAVGRESMRRIFRCTAAAFVFPMTALCLVGIYVALAGVTIPSLGNAPYYMSARVLDHRLTLFCSSVATGSYACLAVFLCVLRLLDRPRPCLCALYGLCLPIAYCTAALSDARIPIVCSCICIGGLGFLLAAELLPIRRRLFRTAISLFVAGAVILALYFGTGLCIRVAGAVAENIAAQAANAPQTSVATNLPEASPLPELSAESPAAELPAASPPPAGKALSKRSLLQGISSLNGRTDVWMSAVDMFRNEPIKLLTGTSPVFIIRDTQPYLSPTAMNRVYPHMHSLPFQTVTALGLPGLVLYLVLIVYIAAHALRVFFLGSGKLTLFERGAALIPLFYTVMDVVDISLWFAPPSSFTSVWYYLAGGYAVYLSKTYLPKKQKAILKIANYQKGAHA